MMVRASQPDKPTFPTLTFCLTGSEAQPSVSSGLVHPPNTVRTLSSILPYFPPPDEAYMFGFFFSLPARRGDPSDIVVLISHQTSAKVSRLGSYTCHPQVRHIHSMPWVLCSRRMSREPPCRMSQTIFICQADKTLSSGDGVLCSGRRLHEPSQPDNHPLSSE